MNTQTDKLSNELGVDLAAIRLAVGKLTGAHRPWDAESPVDLVDQGDRMVPCHEDWLLDDEQKQMFSVQPRDMFILYASTQNLPVRQLRSSASSVLAGSLQLQ